MAFEEVFQKFAQKVLDALPLSPFTEFLDNFAGIPYLGWLNWFFPVSGCLKVMGVWLVAVGTFYLYSILMRWLKMIGD